MDLVRYGTYLAIQALSECNLFPLHNEENQEEVCIITSRNILLKIQNYIELNIPLLSDRQFQNHFRINRTTFEKLLPIVHELIKKETNMGRMAIDTEKQLLSVLWLLATPDSFRSVGERFDMGKSSLSNSFFRIIKALCALAPQIILWPANLNVIREQFYNMSGIDGVVGAIDGTFIRIKAPQKDPESYVTRKCFYAITLQAVCDPKLKFTDCFIGYPGSVSDTRIFRNSDFYIDVCENKRTYFPNNEFILGDKAYPVLPWCIPPYIDRGNLTAQKRNFNLKHAQTRQTIERTFALLFGRFRRLKFLDMNRNDFIPATVLAACVVHNLCISSDDLYIDEYITEGTPLVNGNGNNIIENDGVLGRNNNMDISGHQIRDDLCRRLYEILD